LLADTFEMNHLHRHVDIDEALSAIPKVVKILKSFDPAIPNDLVVYFALKHAKQLGISEVMTGDGSDELFAGYEFMRKIDNLEQYIRRITSNMEFSSGEIGKFFGIKIIQPFLDKKFIDFSLNIDLGVKFKKQSGKIWGKWILRKAFEGSLPEKILWQDKRPLECGSGMAKMRDIVGSKISDKEFERAVNASSIKFISKEHYYYYKVYKDVVGDIPSPEIGEKKCPGCGAGMKPNTSHCKICGNVLPLTFASL